MEVYMCGIQILRLSPFPIIVTTRTSTFLVGDPYQLYSKHIHQPGESCEPWGGFPYEATEIGDEHNLWRREIIWVQTCGIVYMKYIYMYTSKYKCVIMCVYIYILFIYLNPPRVWNLSPLTTQNRPGDLQFEPLDNSGMYINNLIPKNLLKPPPRQRFCPPKQGCRFDPIKSKQTLESNI